MPPQCQRFQQHYILAFDWLVHHTRVAFVALGLFILPGSMASAEEGLSRTAQSGIGAVSTQASPKSTQTINSASKSTGLRLQLSGEEPTGVFFDRDTLKTQTPLVFSVRAFNDLAEERRINLSLRFMDASGKVLAQKNESYRVAGHGLLHRRELFNVSLLGAYQLRVQASASRRGRDDVVSADLPFSLVVAPVGAYRPRSFFALTTPTLLSTRDLDFYARIGARVLRSPWGLQGLGLATAEPAPRLSLELLDRQIRERISRKLATVGVLDMPEDSARSTTLRETWSREVIPLIARYQAIKTWEVATSVSASDGAILSRMARSDQTDLRLLWTLPGEVGAYSSSSSTVANSRGTDSVSVPWLQEIGWKAGESESASPINTSSTALDPLEAHPSGVLRELLTQKKLALNGGVNSFYVHQDRMGGRVPDDISAASSLVSGYLLAIMAGAEGMSVNLGSHPTLASVPNPVLNSRVMARSAAFSTMTRLFEDASFVADVFPKSPVVWTALFKTPATTIATVWSAGTEKGRMLVRLSQADVLDLFGNVQARSRRGLLVVPLSSVPVYIVTRAAPETVSQALRTAPVEGLQPFAVQALPLTQRPQRPPTTITPVIPLAPTKTAMPTGVNANARLTLRVRLQNVLTGPRSGIVRLTPPPGWKLSRDTYNYQLAPGEAHIFQFPVSLAAPSTDNLYPVTVTTSSGRSRWQWKQSLRIATASNVKRGFPVRVDGDLSDWRDVTWMQIQSAGNSVEQARLAIRWDARRLYIAAEVKERVLQARRTEEQTYLFWKGYDALQLAFGTRDSATTQPTREPFRDSDYGFLLSPFNTNSGGSIEGRLLRLWSPTLPFGALQDPVRWGGVVRDSSCAVRRDATAGITRYEASLPLTEMPLLRPQTKATQDSTVRFGWIAHNEDNRMLQWSRTTAMFPWWNNTGSFLPAQRLYYAVQTPLGFTQEGAVDPGPTPAAPPVKTTSKPKPSASTRPRTQRTRRRRRVNPGASQGSSTYGPPEVAPMPPSMLPPAAPQTGNNLPPSLSPGAGR